MKVERERLLVIGGVLRAHRLTRGYTLTCAAKLLGVDKGTLSKWELGKVRPPHYMLARLAELYQLTNLELRSLNVQAGYLLADGTPVEVRSRPEPATDPLALVVQALQRGPWPQSICAAVYALLAAPFHERQRLEQELRAAAERALADLGQTNDVLIGSAPTAEQLTQAVFARVLAEVFGPSGGRHGSPPA